MYARLWLVGDVPSHYTLDGLATHEAGDLLPDVMQTAWAFDRNLRSIAAIAESVDAVMAVSSIPRTESKEASWAERLDRQNQRVISLGKREGWVTIPLHQMNLPESVFEDPIHVNQDGEQQKGYAMAEALMPVLNERRTTGP